MTAASLASGGLMNCSGGTPEAGWASVNEGTEGPPIWDVVESHIRKLGTVGTNPNTSVTVTGV